MSETYTVKAEAREKVGKGAARHLRRNGLVPAVIYGGKQEPQPIAVPYKETFLRLHAGGFLTTIATIEVGGQSIKVLPKDYQLDKVRDFLIHVDYLRVSDTTRVTVEVPVHFVNEEEAPGLKRDGGVLNVVRHTIEVEAPAAQIPDAFTVDLTGLSIGDTIHSDAIKLPRNVAFTIQDRDFTVATIAAPDVLTPEEEAGLPPEAEGEVETTEQDAADEDAAEDEASKKD